MKLQRAIMVAVCAVLVTGCATWKRDDGQTCTVMPVTPVMWVMYGFDFGAAAGCPERKANEKNSDMSGVRTVDE